MKHASFTILAVLLLSVNCPKSEDSVFKVIVLGAGGGLDESNLSCYLISPANENRFVAMDAGSILSGIKKAERAGSFADVRDTELQGKSLTRFLMSRGIKAYLISHAHFDHTSGMIINSPDDGSKTIIGLQNTIDDLRDHVFNGRSWINFSNEGVAPINRYNLIRAVPGKPMPITDTSFQVTAFQLSHSNRGSTAFLLETDRQFVLYFGDTGPDQIEKSTSMQQVWNAIAPIIRENRLRGIFLEISYPDGRPDNQLNSHLTPKWFMTEMRNLAQTVDPKNPGRSLARLRIVVTHIKPSLEQGIDPREIVERQLRSQNDLNLRLEFAEQGKRINL
ncbi:MAG: 3',5'-cyclic-nucleotide phosphodiesterase [Leptospirales bacterium]|nr:3',5'-cyclic-nucleotide phosphodiesterase [Leptospirales bacterium]